METAPVPRAFTAAAAAAAAWLAFYAAWLTLQPWGDRGLVVFGNTAYLVPIAFAAALAWWAWTRTRGVMRVFWALVAASNALWLGAEVLWAIRELSTGEVPFPWWTDAGYLGSFALLALAVPVAFRPSLRTVGAGGLLDGGIAIGALALAWWWVIVRPLSLSADLVSVVGVAYPLFGLLLLGMLAATRLLPARRGTFAMKLFGAGIACTVVADGLYTHAVVTHTYLSGDWIGLGWQAEAVLLCLAALVSGVGMDRRSDWLRWRRPTLLDTGLIVGGGFAVAVAALALEVAAGDPNLIAAGAAALVAALAVVRFALAFSERARLTFVRDPLTGTYDAAYFVEQLRVAALRGHRFGEDFSLLLVDIRADGAEDLVARCASRVARAVRDVDLVARLSDERLAVLCIRVGPAEARDAAERIRAAVVSPPLAGEADSAPARAAVAVAAAFPGESAETLLERAETLLAAAHALSGNHVVGPEADVLLTSASLDDDERTQLATLARMVDLREGDDPDHAGRVSALSRELAAELELGPEGQERAALAGLLHDVGKLATADSLLKRERPIDGREWARSVSHAQRGAELVARIPCARGVAPVLAAQREHWDGTGHPRGLAGDEIPVEARIVAVADAVVSMVSERPYRQPLSLTTALTEVWRWADRRYDPAVVSALFRLLREGRLTSLPVADPAAAPRALADTA